MTVDTHISDLVRTAAPEAVGIWPEFKRCARYHSAMDMMLYLTRDEGYVAERVDDHLTLLWGGLEGTELIGLKLKGFRHMFLKIKQAYPVILEGHFLPLVSFLQVLLTGGLAGEIMQDRTRYEKYRAACELALWEIVDASEVQAAAAA